MVFGMPLVLGSPDCSAEAAQLILRSDDQLPGNRVDRSTHHAVHVSIVYGVALKDSKRDGHPDVIKRFDVAL